MKQLPGGIPALLKARNEIHRNPNERLFGYRREEIALLKDAGNSLFEESISDEKRAGMLVAIAVKNNVIPKWEAIKAALQGEFHENCFFETFDLEESRKREYLFGTSGTEFERVKAIAKENINRIWTLRIEGDDSSISQGLGLVNRMGYYIDSNQDAKPSNITFSEYTECDDDDVN